MWDYNILVPLNDPLPPITEEEVNVATATVSTKKQKKTRKVTFPPLLITSVQPILNREDLNSSEFFHHQVNSAYNQQTKAELILYQHSVLSAPPLPNFPLMFELTCLLAFSTVIPGNDVV